MKQTIFKKDTKGNIRFLTVKSEGIEIVQISGIIGTDSPVEHRKEAKPKNVGRANATTAEEQSLKECEAIIVDKLTKGYFNTPEEARDEEVILPMLALDYFKQEKKIPEDETIIVEPKWDGNRLLIDINPDKNYVKLISRQGKEVTTVPHLYNEALGILAQLQMSGAGRLILDGELYAGTDYTFQECMSLIKKEQPGQEVLQYIVYDVVDTTRPFIERKEMIQELLGTNKYGYYPENKRVICASPYNLVNKHEVSYWFKEAIEMGYEGLMVKKLDGMYKINGRSSDLLKYKEFIDLPLTILDVVPSDARPDHGIVVVDYKGTEVRCGMKVSHEEREKILINKDKYIGEVAEIRFFEYTDEGSLRFPVYHGLKY